MKHDPLHYSPTLAQKSGIRLGAKGILIGLLAMVALLFSALLAGYQYALKEVSKHPDPTAELTEMNQQIGRIEANLARLNALGERLVESAALDPQEFNFQEDVGMGGEMTVPMLKNIEAILDRRYVQLQTLEELLHLHAHHSELTFSKVEGVVTKGWISSFFGYRRDPFTGQLAWHSGVDVVAKEGSEIKALASGIVSYANTKKRYRNLVEIQHSNGLSTRYGHAKEILVKPGQLVRKGEIIALVGSTGRSTGPHVHVEVHQAGQAVDPGKYFPEFKKQRKSA